MSQQGALLALVFVACIAERPIAAWLWRRGRLSDRTAALLLVGRFPACVALILLIMGVDPLLSVVVIVPVTVISALFHRLLRDSMVDVRRELDRRQGRP
jgi:hypothetical protein